MSRSLAILGDPWSQAAASPNHKEPIGVVWPPSKDAPWLVPARAASGTFSVDGETFLAFGLGMSGYSPGGAGICDLG